MNLAQSLQEVRLLFEEGKDRPRVMILFLASISMMLASAGLLFVVLTASAMATSIMGLPATDEKKQLPAQTGPVILGAKKKALR